MIPVALSQPPPPRSAFRAAAPPPKPAEREGEEESKEILQLNVGGSSYRLRTATIRRGVADSRLAHFAAQTHENRLRLCDAYFEATNEYFYERSAKLFDCVYKLYASGQLHRPLDVCESEFLSELQFWRIPESLIATCCQPQYEPIDESLEDLTAAKKRLQDETMRERLYRFCEGDGTTASTIFAGISICFVLISVGGLVLGSIEEFQIPYERVDNQMVVVQNVSKAKTPPGITWEPHHFFAVLETVCIAWFTLEYALRLVVAPDRGQFMRGVLNVVDLLAIFPFYLELVLTIFGFNLDSLSDIKGAFLVVRIMRVLRVVRILKLSRYSTGMRTFALTLKNSARQLGMMGMVLFTGVVFFSTLLYFVEKDEPESPFTSIPTAFWWAIVTMSTVGYGDQIPRTVLGKVIASGAILSGVLVLALPITIIVDQFMKVSGSVQSRALARPRPGNTSAAPSVPPSPINGAPAASLPTENNEKTHLTA
ncbi:hypothetical protein M3Y99_01328500 [Aphelenchoides fujianensis]|nr:hypothetical protein M3Y99_01328500 [Aphelenchoides fujianensis]